MATSALPAAIDAFIAALESADGLDGVKVVDGPPGVNFTEKDRIYVGFAPGADQAAEMQQSFAGAGARQRDEDGTIACYLETRRGDTNIRARRLRAFEILAVVENALRATNENPTAPTLGGTVLWSDLTAGALAQVQENGTLAGLTFTVHFRARI